MCVSVCIVSVRPFICPFVCLSVSLCASSCCHILATIVAVSCGYDICFAVKTCDGLCHFIFSIDRVGILRNWPDPPWHWSLVWQPPLTLGWLPQQWLSVIVISVIYRGCQQLFVQPESFSASCTGEFIIFFFLMTCKIWTMFEFVLTHPPTKKLQNL